MGQNLTLIGVLALRWWPVTGRVLCCALIGQTGTGLRPGAGAAGAAGGVPTPAGTRPTPGGAQQPAEPQPDSEDQAGSDQEPRQATAQLGGAAPHPPRHGGRRRIGSTGASITNTTSNISHIRRSLAPNFVRFSRYFVMILSYIPITLMRQNYINHRFTISCENDHEKIGNI